MPTTKARLNITLSKELEEALRLLAKRDNVPQATKAVELFEEALELEEDRVWEAIANEREAKGGKLIPFEKLWKPRSK